MSSHASAPVTAPLVTVLALALVHRERPEWLAISVGDAARATCFNHERVSGSPSALRGRSPTSSSPSSEGVARPE
jgi:hypothetical protein